MLKRLSFLNWIASVLCWESIGHVSVGLFPDFLFHSVSLLSAAHSFVCCTTFHWANTLRVFTHMLLLTGTRAASTLLPLWIAAVDVLARTPCCTRMRVPLVFTPRSERPGLRGWAGWSVGEELCCCHVAGDVHPFWQVIVGPEPPQHWVSSGS